MYIIEIIYENDDNETTNYLEESFIVDYFLHVVDLSIFHFEVHENIFALWFPI